MPPSVSPPSGRRSTPRERRRLKQDASSSRLFRAAARHRHVIICDAGHSWLCWRSLLSVDTSGIDLATPVADSGAASARMPRRKTRSSPRCAHWRAHRWALGERLPSCSPRHARSRRQAPSVRRFAGTSIWRTNRPLQSHSSWHPLISTVQPTGDGLPTDLPMGKRGQAVARGRTLTTALHTRTLCDSEHVLRMRISSWAMQCS